MVFEAIQSMPEHLSTSAVRMESELKDEIMGLKLSGDDFKVIGCGVEGGVIISQISEPVDFSRILANRIANLVPIDDVNTAIESVNAYTQTIGVYPESLKSKVRDQLAFHGGQRIVSLGYASNAALMSATGAQDALEPMRRMCKWIVDESCDPDVVPLISKVPIQ